MIEIDGPLWFVLALVVCGWHALHLRDWRRERRDYMAWRERYNAAEQQRHDEFMSAMNRAGTDTSGWDLSGRRERGQA